eukprot:TRINITY_DN63200_c0_g1_i1.p1 TRINITY_DN63200_c0_g1~~TRINITY_DN63200_c0_g1_i1.p1  ORF type:complete len:665 (-),score=36.78 TRINITY_DN63200_c0_g1_i1:242-2152(-)
MVSTAASLLPFLHFISSAVCSVAPSGPASLSGNTRLPTQHLSLVQLKASSRGSRNAANASAIDHRKKNVLLIVVDDLRPSLGAYNDTFAHTPNIDNLASTGITFKRAYTQFAWCAPSRNSFLSGRIPDATKTWNFLDHFRQRGIGENWRSLPQFFKEHGYTTASAGKVYHPRSPPNNDYPKSWTLKPYSPECLPPDCPDSLATSRGSDAHSECLRGENLMEAFGISPKAARRTHQWCATDVALDEKNEDKMMIDQLTKEFCIRQLRNVVGEGAPFFVACGFHRPHVPWRFPAEVLKYFPSNVHDVPLPKHSTAPVHMPLVAWHEPGDIKGLLFGVNSTQPELLQREYRLAYAASVSYIDAMIGKVLEELRVLNREDDTLVVLTSDHGYSLGEQGIWDKMSNFESAVRVPLIMRAPWLASSTGAVSSALAELVDLYPTITELAGLPDPREAGEGIDGTSLAPVFSTVNGDSLKKFAFSQFAKPDIARSWKVSTKVAREDLQLMGYSVRTNEWRYSAWFKFDSTALMPDLVHECVSRELYDHRDDDGNFDYAGEQLNLANSAAYADVVQKLHNEIVQRITRGSSSKATALNDNNDNVNLSEVSSDYDFIDETEAKPTIITKAFEQVIEEFDREEHGRV